MLQALVAAIVLFFFGYAIYSMGPDLRNYKWELEPGYLAVAFALIMVRGPLGAYGWREIVRQLGYVLSWWRSVRLVYYSSLAGFVPGGMWHAVSRVYLAEKEGVPRVITGVSVIMEAALNAVGAATVAPLSLIAWRDFPGWTLLIPLAGLVGFMLQPHLFFRVLNWALLKAKRQPVEVQITPLDMLRLVWPYSLNWLLFGVMSYELVAALYPQFPIEQAPALAGVFTMAWLIGYLAVFVPQGLVVREAIMIGYLTGVVGMPAPVAAAAAVLSRLWSMFGVGIWGAISSRL